MTDMFFKILLQKKRKTTHIILDTYCRNG